MDDSAMICIKVGYAFMPAKSAVGFCTGSGAAGKAALGLRRPERAVWRHDNAGSRLGLCVSISAFHGRDCFPGDTIGAGGSEGYFKLWDCLCPSGLHGKVDSLDGPHNPSQ